MHSCQATSPVLNTPLLLDPVTAPEIAVAASEVKSAAPVVIIANDTPITIDDTKAATKGSLKKKAPPPPTPVELIERPRTTPAAFIVEEIRVSDNAEVSWFRLVMNRVLVVL